MAARKFVIVPFILIISIFPPHLHSENSRGLKVAEVLKPFGTYHALIIGINSYTEWPGLKTAANDARALKKVLIDKYGFDQKNVILRVDNDANLETLMYDFRDLELRLDRQDNLIIYYAGHGQLNDLAEGGGYWIPADGKIDDPGSWIPHSIIKDILSSDKILAKNVALVSDSCYSGEILRSGRSNISLNDTAYRKKILTESVRRSRQVFTSGGIEPVQIGARMDTVCLPIIF